MSEIDLEKIKPNYVADARGSSCPGPLLEAKKSIGKVPKGGVLEVKSNDPGTKNDLPVWAKKAGHKFLGVLEAPGYDRIFIQRGK
ncbi:MAG: sulfurtransferase TusA family protein [Candidatus Heimdallarchaeaceae archaeon]